MGENINTVKKKAEALLDVKKEVGLEVKYVCLVTRMQHRVVI
jgi:hypothetical protein